MTSSRIASSYRREIDTPRYRCAAALRRVPNGVVLGVDRRAIAVLVLGLGLIGFLVVGSSSGLVRPAAWRPGSLAGQPGPEGSTWLGIGDEVRYRDFTVRVAGIDDRRCPGECVSAGEFRVLVDVSSTAVGRRQVVLVYGARPEVSEARVGAYRIRIVDTANSRVPFVWQGAALLITDLSR